jgi:hypothetical protein
MKQAFTSMFACAALIVAMSVSTITANAAQGACSYQACFNKCVQKGSNNSSMCARGCARYCYN